MSDDWQAGDLALCVDGSVNPDWLGCAQPKQGRLYTVTGVVRAYSRKARGIGVGLDFRGEGFPYACDALRFRKIRPHTPDEQDAETIALLNGKPVRGDA